MRIKKYFFIFILKLQPLVSLTSTEFENGFCNKPFISPKIVYELSNEKKNFGNQVIAINLMGAEGSNRYFGETKIETSSWVCQEDNDDIYEYRFIDQTKEGIYIIHQRSKKKSSDSFQSILLLELKKDYGIFFDSILGIDKGPNRVFSADWGVDLTKCTTCHGGPKRLLAIKLCEIPLTNSWDGEIRLKNNCIHISELGKFRFESFTFRKVYDYLETIGRKIFSKYYQAKDSYQSLIHEGIIQDLHTWVSDMGDQIVSIDLLTSGNYEENISEQEEEHFYPPFFHYWHLGQTKNNIHIFRIEEGTGGRGIFPNVMMIAFEQDKGMYIDWEKKLIRRSQKRLLAKKLGEIQLPMHWWGSLQVEGNTLIIGDHEGVAVPLCYCENQKTAAVLEFKKQDERIFCITHQIRD